MWVTNLSWLDKKFQTHWPKRAGVGMIERRRDIIGMVSKERAFSIGSKGVTSAASFANAARSHWGIENSLHWVAVRCQCVTPDEQLIDAVFIERSEQ